MRKGRPIICAEVSRRRMNSVTSGRFPCSSWQFNRDLTVPENADPLRRHERLSDPEVLESSLHCPVRDEPQSRGGVGRSESASASAESISVQTPRTRSKPRRRTKKFPCRTEADCGNGSEPADLQPCLGKHRRTVFPQLLSELGAETGTQRLA